MWRDLTNSVVRGRSQTQELHGTMPFLGGSKKKKEVFLGLELRWWRLLLGGSDREGPEGALGALVIFRSGSGCWLQGCVHSENSWARRMCASLCACHSSESLQRICKKKKISPYPPNAVSSLLTETTENVLRGPLVRATSPNRRG